MVTDFSFLLQTMAWPLVLLLAWFLAERLYGLWRIPRVSSYVAVGLLGGLLNLPGLTGDVPGLPFLANVALSLVLFELGYRINLRWFRHNPWVLLLGVTESIVTFGLIYAVTGWFDLALDVRLIIAALSISTSPAGIVRVANELRGAGQVTERVLHLCAINCLMSVLALKLVVGYWYLSTSGDLVLAAFGSIHVLATSVAAGALLGVLAPWLLGQRGTHERSVTVVFALAVVLLTTMSYGLKLSPLLGALTFGIVARERRVHLTNAQRDFGTAGDLLSVFLFVYIAALLDWADVGAGMLLGTLLIAVRTASKVGCSLAAARISGITERKGMLTGLALTPMSAFAILLLEQSRLYGFDPAVQVLSAMAGMMLVQELLGPVVTQRALMAAHETHVTKEG
ncbi:MAG: cation:proton antiporter [Hydrogenophaga sp.]|jgi:Kef-type K+ transport system membrane component KefB|uniref:cation:proton antiporter n=1 Tax=Hydrogenophaga sp. TaxID=1904254 RepID=UPI00271BBEE6|nr:cation:proton antiporter [Hydrogenophaga sp.]MDO9568554.1 cation:proton antiporter [Hydrogenophaga sp.]MDP3345112.1 cation:proton antiporter [Hydrogenophaga sp.]MDP3373081.1 cation:proton antiporter [Hydrogenophaga sp.]MDP3806077.1 cation:proton antiporter [Hydrogenophaga sp.]MDP3925664.1 cation:proton antiporter [Hydrogenophaga sp.]